MNAECELLCTRLQFYERDGMQYARCLCRGTEVVISGRPEEIVRQTLLHYLICESGLIPNEVELAVERHNVDIAVLKLYSSDCFRPLRHPLLVIEVKRDGFDLPQAREQLARYMRERKTEVGVLFNGSGLLVCDTSLESAGTFISHESLDVLKVKIVELLARENSELEVFHAACGGDVASFVKIVDRYAKHTLHKITFALASSGEPITGCCFTSNGTHIMYNIYGRYSKRRFDFRRSEFGRLISVVY